MRRQAGRFPTRMRPFNSRRSPESGAVASARSSAAHSLWTRCPPPSVSKGSITDFHSQIALFTFFGTVDSSADPAGGAPPEGWSGRPVHGPQLFQPSKGSNVKLDELHQVGPSVGGV
jgi:hypothetical protein